MRCTVLLLLTLIVACDESKDAKPDSTPPVEVPTKAGVAKEVAKGVKDVATKKGPQWKVNYSGDYSGSIEGTVLVASGKSAVGSSHRKSEQGHRPGIRVTQMAEDKFSVRLTLPDGAQCKDDLSEKQLSAGKVLDAGKDTYKAELSGNLVCGEEKKKIKYTATLNKNP